MATLTFTNPEALWFLFAIPLLILTHFVVLRYSKRRALKFANFAVLKRATGQKYITKNYSILIIRLFIITTAILAVAGTTLWYESKTNENEYVITLDTSASMSAQDIAPTRLDAAKIYAQQFVDALDSRTKIGIVSFSGVTFVEQPLTEDRSEVKDIIDQIEISASGTDLAGAVITSTNLLISSERGRAMILITDGSNTIETFESKSLQRASDYAKRNRVKIYTIGVGSDLNSPIGYLPTYYNISSSYNEQNLIFLSNITDGPHFSAKSEAELQAAYESIRASDQTSTLPTDLSAGFMLCSLALIMVEWGLINTRFRLLP